MSALDISPISIMGTEGARTMQPPKRPTASLLSWPVVVRPDQAGQHTAEAVGIPEIRATATTREEAIEQVRQMMGQWFACGQLAEVEVPREDLRREWEAWEKSD